MTEAQKYRRGPGTVLHRGKREVLTWQGEAHFRCPCGERQVVVRSPPHGIEFDDDGVLTIEGSCGYTATDERPKNWCHFHIKAGVPKMVSDAQCPGNA